MKKRTLFSLVITLTLFAVMFITGGLMGLNGSKNAYAVTPKPETDTFAMRQGASIKNSDPSGIRFTTYVDPDYYGSLVESGKEFHFGTIYAPATAYSGTIEEFTHESVLDDEKSNEVNDVVVSNEEAFWGTDTVNEKDYKIYNTVQMYSENARNNGYYGVKIFARSYVCVDGVYTYADGVVRSIAQVAASALASGEDSEYIDVIPDYALGAKNVVGTNDTAVTVNGFTYHKDGVNSGNSSRNNQDYIYLPVGGTCDFKYTPALKHSGDYMTGIEDYEITYSSGNESVFTVNGNGTITAVGVGSAVLTASVGTNVVAPVCTVNVINATTESNAQGVAESYLLDDVTYYADSHILNFDAAYIANKMAAGYTHVQFTVNCPGTGNKSVRLLVNAAETTIASGAGAESFVSDIVELASDTTYSILCRQSTAETLDMTVVAQFIKPINAYKESNNSAIDYTSVTSTTITENDTITYTFKSVSNATFNRFYFTESYIAEKMAEGYTYVSFVIDTWGNKEAWLYENETEKGHVLTNGNDPFDCGIIPLTEDAYYYIRLYHNVGGAPANITVTVKFIKPVYAYKESDNAKIEFTCTTTEDSSGELMTFTFDDVPNATFNRFYFGENFIAEKMAAGYNKVEFNIYTWGAKVANLYENTTQIGSMSTNGRDPFTCGEIALTENAYYYIQLYHNVGSAPADITVTVRFTTPEQQAFNILATASSYGNHYHGTFGGVSSSGNSVSVVAGKGGGSDYRGFTLTPAAIQAMYNLGFSAVTFTVNSPTGYIDLYNMADPANCVIGTRANIVGGDHYFANGTITLNLANLVNDATAMASEGIKFVVTNDASWTVYATNCTVTFSDITFTPV